MARTIFVIEEEDITRLEARRGSVSRRAMEMLTGAPATIAGAASRDIRDPAGR